MQLSKHVISRATHLRLTRPYVMDITTFETTAGDRLDAFVTQKYHGSMDWMETTLPRRRHPENLWADARSAIIVGLNYGPSSDPLCTLSQKSHATISVYARGRDYHDVLKGRLKELAGLIARDTGADVKVFVDTAPLMEKPLAAKAGLGWQGKHTNLVNRDYGSWLFLGVILSAAELTPDEPEIDHCGSCRACLDICPTDAFPAPYTLDARKCISYLTIEHKGAVDEDLRKKMGNRIYGCDDCLAVCPWNKFAQTASEAKLQARDELNAPTLKSLSQLTETEFRTHFSGSPIKRIGRDQFIRNVLYAIGNSQSAELLPSAQAHLQSDNPIVRDAAQWATQRLTANPGKHS